MSDRLSRMIEALSPVMNPVQAEGFLHLTAVTREKPLESLGIEDWPAIERTIREALRGTPSDAKVDVICARLHMALLADADASGC